MSVTVVIPCLDEEETIEASVKEALEAFADEKKLEVLVVDNGSKDRSKELALKAGARVVEERRRGYGSAILRGFFEAQNEYLVMGDADLTYDFHDAKTMVEELRASHADFAIGDRLNGDLEKGAMPVLHQKIGTPVLSFVLNRFFGSRVKDINCGLRAFRREHLPRMRLQSTGMEFASEMVIHAHKAGLKFIERPIRYRNRGGGEAKLRTLRDGWRHLRFILLAAPFPVFVLPSVLFLLASVLCFFDERFGVQVLGSLLMLLGAQVFFFGLVAKAFLWVADSFLVDQKVGQRLERFRLEYGILCALALFAASGVLFYQFDLSSLIRGATIAGLGAHIFFGSFLLSMVMSKKRWFWSFSPE